MISICMIILDYDLDELNKKVDHGNIIVITAATIADLPKTEGIEGYSASSGYWTIVVPP